MTRHIVPSREVYHIWAQGNTNTGKDGAAIWARNANNSVSFDGARAFSYAAIIGRIVRDARKGRAYLLTTRTWSVTTSKHQSFLRASIPAGELVFTVAHIEAPDNATYHKLRVADYLDRIGNAYAKSKRARVNADMWRTVTDDLLREMQSYCAYFGVKAPIIHLADLAAGIERARAQEAKRTRAQEAKQRKELASKADQWRNGTIDYMPSGYPDTLLRVRADGDRSNNGAEARRSWTVETSRGARIPYDTARYLFCLWEDGTLEPGATAGQYTVNGVTNGALMIGCHTITMNEARRLAIAEHWALDDATAA